MQENSARATPQEGQESIRTLDLSLLARKNSIWSFAIRQTLNVLSESTLNATQKKLLISVFTYHLFFTCFNFEYCIFSESCIGTPRIYFQFL